MCRECSQRRVDVATADSNCERVWKKLARYAATLADIAGVNVHDLAMAMFEAKADISHLSPLEIVNMDSKASSQHVVAKPA